jgi:hypothetical protein
MPVWKSSGVIRYDPNAARSTFRKHWVILQCDKELIRYYQHIYYKLYWKKLQTAIWSSHISIVRGEVPKYSESWKRYDGQEIEFNYEYDGKFEHNKKHYWLKCWSKGFEEIRVSLGLEPNPIVPFHLSIGSRND